MNARKENELYDLPDYLITVSLFSLGVGAGVGSQGDSVGHATQTFLLSAENESL